MTMFVHKELGAIQDFNNSIKSIHTLARVTKPDYVTLHCSNYKDWYCAVTYLPGLFHRTVASMQAGLLRAYYSTNYFTAGF